MKVFKETSDLHKKVEKLCAYADELGITLEVVSNMILVSSNTDNGPSAILVNYEDLNDSIMLFPPLTQFKLRLL